MLSRALALVCALSACQSSAKTKTQPIDAGVDGRPPPPTTVDIRLFAPGWGSEAMERQGLVPLETALRRASELVGMEGAAVRGAAFMTLTFQPSVTPAEARRAAADLARGSLPQEVAVEIVPASRAELRFALRSDTLPLVEGREIVERIVLPRLARVPGVVETRACGGARRQATVILDADRLAGVKLSLREVTAALARPAPYAAPDELRAVVAGVRNGVPLRIGDVALVEVGAAPPDCWVAQADGKLGVEGSVTVADAHAFAAMGAALDDVRAELPAGVAIDRPSEPTLRLTVRTLAGATDPALVHSLTVLRDAAPAAIAWRDRRGAAPDELELRIPAASLGAVARALAATPMLGPARTPDDEIRVAVAGSELEPLAAAAEAVRAALAQVQGAAAVGTVGASRDAPHLEVKPDPQALARAGIAPGDLDAYVRAATRGLPVARLRDGAEDIPVVVRFPQAREDFQALAGLVVPAAGGSAVPIGSLARITLEAEPSEILRRDGQRIALVWVRPGPDADRRSLRIALWGAAWKVTLPLGVRLLGP